VVQRAKLETVNSEQLRLLRFARNDNRQLSVKTIGCFSIRLWAELLPVGMGLRGLMGLMGRLEKLTGWDLEDLWEL